MGGNTELLVIFFKLLYSRYNNSKIKKEMDKKVLLIEDRSELVGYLYPTGDEEAGNFLSTAVNNPSKFTIQDKIEPVTSGIEFPPEST